MTAFLASVRDCAEAEIVLREGADIIDCKDPDLGALGAVPHAEVRRIVEQIGTRCPVSATIGDLPMQADAIVAAAAAMASTGVDYVKIGVLPEPGAFACVAALGRLAAEGTRIVVLGFADRPLGFPLIAAASEAGLHGVMLDTADKGGGSLTDRMPLAALAAFVADAKACGLMVGLAGSLRPEHIAPLEALGPDLLGFRGALCAGGRTGRIDAHACRRIREQMTAPQIFPVPAVA